MSMSTVSEGRRRRLGLFGGSFDPIHRGHIEPVLGAQEALGLDRVLFLPTANPPHKLDRRLAPAWQRYAMVELALLGFPDLHAHPHELRQVGPAYTIETLESFSQTEPDSDLFLLVGEDSFQALPTWRRGLDIPALATVAVMRRPHSEPSVGVTVGNASECLVLHSSPSAAPQSRPRSRPFRVPRTRPPSARLHLEIRAVPRE